MIELHSIYQSEKIKQQFKKKKKLNSHTLVFIKKKKKKEKELHSIFSNQIQQLNKQNQYIYIYN